MRWNVRPETESEYFEFLVHEFIPAMSRLGITEFQVWYTAFGNCEQKLASGVAPSIEHMNFALHNEDWDKLMDKLQHYVEDFSKKVVPATRGFQI